MKIEYNKHNANTIAQNQSESFGGLLALPSANINLLFEAEKTSRVSFLNLSSKDESQYGKSLRRPAGVARQNDKQVE